MPYKNPRSGITRNPPPTPNSPPSRPPIPPRPAAAAARITVAIMRADDAGEHRRIESAGSEILPARTVSALASVPRSRDTDQGDQSNPILSASGSGRALSQANPRRFQPFSPLGDIEDNPIPFAEAGEPRPLKGRDMHEHVLAAAVPGDKAVAPLGVKPFH